MGMLYFGDNLEVFRKGFIREATVDLIYLDPPFNSKKQYNIIFKTPKGFSSEAQSYLFKDYWEWGEAEKEYDEVIHCGNVKIATILRALRSFLGQNDLMAYLTMMTNRLLEMHKLLKPEGSLFLHCDPTASHYLKVILDGIFGGNFKNEIIWHYSGWNAKLKTSFNSRHDTILFYSKSPYPKFLSYSVPWTSEEEYLKTRKQKVYVDATGRKYVLSDAGHGSRIKRYIDEAMAYGKPVDDVWEIDKINNSSKEALGYPTQKPLSLIERIILACTETGDLILDPFCGCGTTIHAAEKHKRAWIGVDVTHLAITIVEERLKKHFPEVKYQVNGTPLDLEGAIDLAKRSPYNFESWACSLIGAYPFNNGKKGADKGIDGKIFFNVHQKDEEAVVSIKSGEHLNVSAVRELICVTDREKAKIGVLVTLYPPTRGMREEASNAGFYKPHFVDGKFPKIQILTIDGLLKGTEQVLYPDISRGAVPSRKGRIGAKVAPAQRSFFFTYSGGRNDEIDPQPAVSGSSPRQRKKKTVGSEIIMD